VTSFTLDLIFVEGITGVQGEETLAFIIIFLLWRVLRVINGTHTVYGVYITTFDVLVLEPGHTFVTMPLDCEI